VRSSLAAAERANTEFDVAIVHPCRWTQAPELLRHLRIPAVYYAHEGRRRSIEPGYNPSVSHRSWPQGVVHRVGRDAYEAVAGALDRRAMRSRRRTLRFATNSNFTAGNLQAAYGIDAEVIAPGVDTTRFTFDATVQPSDSVLFVGALDPTKGADLVVDAVALIPAVRRPPLRMVYGRGNPSFEAAVRRRASERSVSVVLRADIDDASLVEEYRRALVHVAAARAEPFGLTVPEANACGTPVIAVREGGYCETVVDGSGVLTVRRPDALAVAIDDTLRGRVSFDRAAIAQSAAQRWSWDRTTAELLDVCGELVRA
jgi:glycosyltransferase involved in cell wall biosynthesis